MPYQWLEIIGDEADLPVGGAPIAVLDLESKTITPKGGSGFNVVSPSGSYAPTSGTSGTGAGTWASPGAIYYATGPGAFYVNKGSLASPYWYPTDFKQPGILGGWSDFRDGVGKANSDTAATAKIAGSGIRVFGQGIAETDSGLVPAYGEGEIISTLQATDEDAHLAALGFGDSSFSLQPDTHGPLVIEGHVAMSSAITLRAFVLGWLGAAADALDPAFTYATTVVTMPLDDCAALTYSAEMTDADRIYAPHNKSNEAADIDADSDTTIDTEVDFPAAGTYALWRLEIHRDGRMVGFKDKAQIVSIAAALDVNEEAFPAMYVESTSTAVKAMLVKSFGAWGAKAA